MPRVNHTTQIDHLTRPELHALLADEGHIHANLLAIAVVAPVGTPAPFVVATEDNMRRIAERLVATAGQGL